MGHISHRDTIGSNHAVLGNDYFPHIMVIHMAKQYCYSPLFFQVKLYTRGLGTEFQPSGDFFHGLDADTVLAHVAHGGYATFKASVA